jgi:4a-hydroxytetrahydrobiopterin dehydratase
MESIDQDLPISVQKPMWSLLENPSRIFRNFKFDNIKSLEDFIMELIDYQENAGHHAKIIMENLNIGIETYTHTLNEVTELDLELAKFCDLLYEDVKHYYSPREEDPAL